MATSPGGKNKEKMNLGNDLWTWRKQKLGCRIREETGNPAVDEIRDQLSRMTGVVHPSLEQKDQPKGDEKQPLKKKASRLALVAAAVTEVPAVKAKNLSSLTAFEERAKRDHEAMPLTRKNINKKYFNIPWNPPTKVLRDVQRDRIRLAIPAAFREEETHSKPKKTLQSNVRSERRRQCQPEEISKAKEEKKEVSLEDQKDGLPFKSYSGDLFGTRGEYMGGIIYQSRVEFTEEMNSGGLRKQILSPKTTKKTSFHHERKVHPPSFVDSNNKKTSDPSLKDSGERQRRASSSSSSSSDERQPKKKSNENDDDLLLETPNAVQATTSAFPSLLNKKENEEEEPFLLVDKKRKNMRGVRRATYDDDVDLIANEGERPRRSSDSASLEAKLHCAKSLANWSLHAENVSRLAEEGAVAAALVLSKEANFGIRKSCATALKRMSQHRKLCEQLVDCAAVALISDLGVGANDIGVSRDCGLALVNLTHMNGDEPKLVEDGIVIAFMSLMNQHDELSDMCSRGLFNLTCVDEPYQYMERVMKAFIALASSTSPTVKHVCAAALCNLSDIKPIRGRIVEEGVVQIIGVLARGAEARTRRVCAIILHLLSSTRQCRPDMVSKGTVQVLYSLSSDVDTITLHYIASALMKLATEEQNLPRLVHEGGVTALCNICLRCPQDAATTRLCASALSLLSQQAIGRQAIVQEGCVPAIVTLLKEAGDAATIRNGLGAFTNLLMDEANHERVLAQGGISAVIGLCSHQSSDIREACALALFNFSRGEVSRETSVSAAAVPALIALSKLPEPRTRMRCAATLCKLASVEQNVALMVEADVVRAFIDMLRSSNNQQKEIVKHSCAALCRLAHEGTSASMIAEGAVPYVIAGCGRSSDAATREACCAVLSAVSAHEPCRQPLCAMGVLQALMGLATDRSTDDTTRLRCAVAFANLSNESSVRKEMVDAGIVPVLADLSNSYCEENQLYCARALCNLGCHPGSEDAIVRQGGVAALMMISMVRAVSHFTKQVCANALLNLMSPPEVRKRWLAKLAEDGLVRAVSVLSRLEEEETMSVCAKIFCMVSTEGEAGRALFVDRRSTLKDVFALMRSKDHATRLVCGKAVCNLLGHEDSQTPAVAAGATKVLSALCNLGDFEAEAAAASAFFLVAEQETCRREIVHPEILPVLLKSAKSPTVATMRSCLQVLGHLASFNSLRAPLISGGAVSSLVDLAHRLTSTDEDNGLGSPADLLLQALASLSLAPELSRKAILEAHVVGAFRSLYEHLVAKKKDASLSPSYARRTREFIATALRSLAEPEEGQDKLVEDGGAKLLCDLIAAAAASKKVEKSPPENVVFEHCASTICKLARRQRYGERLLRDGVLEALPTLCGVVVSDRSSRAPASCYAFAAAIIHVLSMDAVLRESLVTHKKCAVAGALAKIVEARDEDPLPSSTVPSCAQALYWWSRCSPDTRDDLAGAGIVTLLVRLSRSDDSEKVAASCSEALKNFSSDVSGGIEEGTVSSLIAMTLGNGKLSKNTEVEQRLFVDVPYSAVHEHHANAPSDELFPAHALRAFRDYAFTTGKAPGGTAGAGPPPPEPPEMDLQDTLTVADLGDTNDANNDDNDDSTVASMMFAKMTVGETDRR